MAQVMLLCYSAVCSHAATEGYGQHAEALGGKQAALAAKITIIGQTFCRSHTPALPLSSLPLTW